MTMKNNLKSSIDNIVEEILNVHNQKAFKVRALRFTEDAFSCDSTEIDWVLFCDAAKKHSASKFALLFLCSALRHNISFGDYTTYLLENQEIYEEMTVRKQRVSEKVFCGSDLAKQVVCRNECGGGIYSYYYRNNSGKQHKDIYTITTEDIIQNISHRNITPATAHTLYQGVYQVYYLS